MPKSEQPRPLPRAERRRLERQQKAQTAKDQNNRTNMLRNGAGVVAIAGGLTAAYMGVFFLQNPKRYTLLL